VAAKNGIMQAQMMQALTAMPPNVNSGGGAPPPGGNVDPAGVAQAGNMGQLMAA
jgi:hypothetical protein